MHLRHFFNAIQKNTNCPPGTYLLWHNSQWPLALFYFTCFSLLRQKKSRAITVYSFCFGSLVAKVHLKGHFSGKRALGCSLKLFSVFPNWPCPLSPRHFSNFFWTQCPPLKIPLRLWLSPTTKTSLGSFSPFSLFRPQNTEAFSFRLTSLRGQFAHPRKFCLYTFTQIEFMFCMTSLAHWE